MLFFSFRSQVIPKKIEKSKDCREDAAERYGEAGKQKRDVRFEVQKYLPEYELDLMDKCKW